MTEFKCLKAVFIFNFFRSYLWMHVLITIYDVIIQKITSPQKSKEDVVTKFYKS